MSHASVLVAVKGKRREIESLVSYQMEPFNENGEWFKKGSRWDCWKIGGRYTGSLPDGECIQVKTLTPEHLEQWNRTRAGAEWERYENERPEYKVFWKMPQGMTRENYIKREAQAKLYAYAFLREQRWYENERLGFFGGKAATECEVEAGRTEGKCIVGSVSKPPCIITFNEPDDRWREHYWQRFIAPLDSETWLVIVDYHV